MTVVNNLNKKQVKISNAVARMRYSSNEYVKTSRWEGRIIAIVAAQVSIEDDEFREYKIPIRFLEKIAGLKKSGNLSKRLLEVARTLAKRYIEIEGQNGWAFYSLFSECHYIKGDKHITVRFDPDLKDHYIGIKKHFTTFILDEYLSLPSTYSQHLYHFLRSWDDQIGRELKFSVEYLHKKLNAPTYMRKNYAEFKRYALDIAKKHINKLTTLKYTYKRTPKGRKPNMIKFTITDNGKKKKITNQPLEKILKGVPDYTLAKIPEDQKEDLKVVLKDILEKYGVTGVRCFIGYTHQKRSTIKKTWGAFIGGLLKKGWYVERQAEADKDKYALYDLPPASKDEFDPWGPGNIDQIQIWASTPQHEYHKRARVWLTKNGHQQPVQRVAPSEESKQKAANEELISQKQKLEQMASQIFNKVG